MMKNDPFAKGKEDPILRNDMLGKGRGLRHLATVHLGIK
jgi:hypothetical protein